MRHLEPALLTILGRGNHYKALSGALLRDLLSIFNDIRGFKVVNRDVTR